MRRRLQSPRRLCVSLVDRAGFACCAALVVLYLEAAFWIIHSPAAVTAQAANTALPLSLLHVRHRALRRDYSASARLCVSLSLPLIICMVRAPQS